MVEVIEALEWYAETVAGCRKHGPDGDKARAALDTDGGKRAVAAMTAARPPVEEGEVERSPRFLLAMQEKLKDAMVKDIAENLALREALKATHAYIDCSDLQLIEMGKTRADLLYEARSLTDAALRNSTDGEK